MSIEKPAAASGVGLGRDQSHGRSQTSLRDASARISLAFPAILAIMPHRVARIARMDSNAARLDAVRRNLLYSPRERRYGKGANGC